jgi:eukaryotic-like serine/threonine-protein kinase
MEESDAGGEVRQPPKIPGFAVLRRLGSGATGTVWLVQPDDGGAPLAAKCFLPEVAGEAPGARINESEITLEWRILSNYDHDHLVKVHAVVPLDGAGRAIIMDHAAGGSVRDIVAVRGPLGVGEAVTILTPVAQVLSYLHGQGVVHGDVSPGNVLLTAHGKPMVADLGLGKMLGQAPGAGTGTPGFAPEHDAAVTAASDVYAAAAVGWFALTGQPPPSTRNRAPLRTYVPAAPAELAAALEAALNDNAAQRPTAAELAQAVYRSARAEPVELAVAVHPSVLPDLLTRRDARGRGRPARAPRRGKTVPALQVRRRWAGVAAVVLLGAAAVTVPAVVGRLGPDPVPAAVTATTASPPVPAVLAEGRLPAEVRGELFSADPATALKGLAWLRSYALAESRPELLAQVNAAGSPAQSRDTTVLEALRKAGHSYAGLETVISKAATVPGAETASAGKTVVEAIVETSAFAEQDRNGAVVHAENAAQHQRLRFLLSRAGGRWLISDVLPGTK